jgi:hypothetical protein
MHRFVVGVGGMIDMSELLARTEICDVLARYAHAIDRGDRQLARTCYHDDAIDNHGRINAPVDDVFAFFESYGAELRSTYHFMGVPLIVVDTQTGTDPNRAKAETYCIYRRELIDDDAEVLFQGLRYFDELECREGVWRIARRTVILDWEHVGTPFPSVVSPASWTRGGRLEHDVASPITDSLAQAVGLRH